jgi:hypothetical protein
MMMVLPRILLALSAIERITASVEPPGRPGANVANGARREILRVNQLGLRDAGGSSSGHLEKLAAMNHGFVSFIEWVEAILGWLVSYPLLQPANMGRTVQARAPRISPQPQGIHESNSHQRLSQAAGHHQKGER